MIADIETRQTFFSEIKLPLLLKKQKSPGEREQNRINVQLVKVVQVTSRLLATIPLHKVSITKFSTLSTKTVANIHPTAPVDSPKPWSILQRPFQTLVP